MALSGLSSTKCPSSSQQPCVLARYTANRRSSSSWFASTLGPAFTPTVTSVVAFAFRRIKSPPSRGKRRVAGKVSAIVLSASWMPATKNSHTHSREPQLKNRRRASVRNIVLGRGVERFDKRSPKRPTSPRSHIKPCGVNESWN